MDITLRMMLSVHLLCSLGVCRLVFTFMFALFVHWIRLRCLAYTVYYTRTNSNSKGDDLLRERERENKINDFFDTCFDLLSYTFG